MSGALCHELLDKLAKNVRFHDIAWSQPNETSSRGVIAGALENGSLDLWNAKRLRNGDG